MASVFQRDGIWYAKFKNERGLWVPRSCGGADKATSQRLAQAWEDEAREVREGRVDPRAKRFQSEAVRPLSEHVADFRAMLAAKGNTPEHVAETTAHVERVILAMGAKLLVDLSSDGVRRVIAGIRDGGRALRTCNAILRSVKTFGGWLEADGRIRHNDLRHVQSYNAEADKRRIRRDISDDELGRIIAAANAGPVSFGLSGVDRGVAYRLAAGTGFRRGELASITKASFALEGEAPTVTVSAAYSKRRRGDTQPIDAGLALDLAKWLVGKPDGVRVLPLPDETAEMLTGDMRRAKAKWIRETSSSKERRKRAADAFLSVSDGEGRVFDFHALRHHYISRVVESGASVKVCQELARHSSPVLTLGRYAHVRLADLRKALPTVPTGDRPKPEEMRLRATGTDNDAPLMHQTGREIVRGSASVREGAEHLKLAGDDRNPLHGAEMSKAPQINARPCECEGDGVRTRNHRIDNPVL